HSLMKTIELNRKKLSNGLGLDNQEAIQTYQISDVVIWMELDLQPQEDMMLQLNDSQNAYLHFIYNFEGRIQLKSNQTSHGQTLSSFQSAMVHDKLGNEVYIALKGGNHYHISIAQLVKLNKKKETNSLFLQFEK